MKLLTLNRFFAYGIPDEKLGQRLVLIVEGEEVKSEIKELFFKNIQAILSKYEVPKEIYFVKIFIETATGKVDKMKIIAHGLNLQVP